MNLTGLTVFGQTTESKKQTSKTVQTDTLNAQINLEEYDERDHFSPGLFLFLLTGIIFFLACVGVGIVLTILGLLIIFGLISIGILSASIIIGLNKKSFAKGFKTFIILTSTIGGALLGGLGFWLLHKITLWWTDQTAILGGATCGLITGLAFGFVAYYLLRWLTTYFTLKLKFDKK